jgi:hypothetical protein
MEDRAERRARWAEKRAAELVERCAAEDGHRGWFLRSRRLLAQELISRAVQAHTEATRGCAQAAHNSANACEQIARAHERLAKAQPRNFAEHWQLRAAYLETAAFLHDAVFWYEQILKGFEDP